MVGHWRVQVRLGDAAAQHAATFALPVTSQPLAPPPNQAPLIDSNTLALGLVEILAGRQSALRLVAIRRHQLAATGAGSSASRTLRVSAVQLLRHDLTAL
jgi:hypothetical protein